MNDLRRRPFLAWPGWAHLRFAWLLTVAVTALFLVVYGGADWLTEHRSLRVRVYLDGELHIPLVPCFLAVYMSVYALFLAAPFVLRDRREIIQLAVCQSVSIIIAGIVFILVPAQLAYPPPNDAELGIWKDLFYFAERLNLKYNLAPSLHVALSITCAELFGHRCGCVGRVLLRAWGFVIAASTVLTHQHHLLDVATGYLLALAIVKFFAPAKH